MMLRLTSLLFPLLAMLASQSASAAGQTLYKCRISGKLTYSGAPCKGTTSTQIAVPEAPPAPPNQEQNLKRQKSESAKLQKQRESREAEEQGTMASDDNLTQLRRQRCAALASGTTTPATVAADAAKQAVEEKVERASDDEKMRVRREAERTAGSLTEEC